MSERASYRVMHETRYAYSDVVTSAHQLAHLRPRATDWQKVKSHKLTIEPKPVEQLTGGDYFGNDVLRFMIDTPHDELVVRAESVVDVQSSAPDEDAPSPAWEACRAAPGEWGPNVDLEVESYRVGSPMAPVLEEAQVYGNASFTPERPWLEAMLDLVMTGLLIATISYAVILNRRLGQLRQDRSSLDAAVKEFALAHGLRASSPA